MSFVRDITIGEGEAVPPSTKFIKTWRIKNIGKKQLLNHKSWQKTLDLLDVRLRGRIVLGPTEPMLVKDQLSDTIVLNIAEKLLAGC